MYQINPAQKHQPHDDRSGLTLTEVLMSLMIMAIGVTSVMTLFPIATLRSAQASKLTNAAVLRYSLETQLDIDPRFIFDPDGDGDLNEHFNTPASRNYIVDPSGFYINFEHSRDLAGRPAPDPDRFVRPDFFGHFEDDNTVSGVFRFDGSVARDIAGIIDGRIAEAVFNDEQLRALRLESETRASLGDNWEVLYDFVPSQLANSGGGPVNNGDASGATVISGVVLPVDVVGDVASAQLIPTTQTLLQNLGGFRIQDPERTRITLFSPDKEFSHSYPLLAVDTSSAAPICTWSETIAGDDFNGDGQIESRGLPREFLVANTWQIGRVLIEQQKPVDYTWLLTVRRAPDGRVRSMDAVIRFGDALRPNAERLHPTRNFSDDNGNGTQDPGEELSPRFIEMDVSGEPSLRRGGYIFDVGNARWYRVRNWETQGTRARIEFERPTVVPFSNAAIVLPGVVDVFPMGSRSIPESVRRGF